MSALVIGRKECVMIEIVMLFDKSGQSREFIKIVVTHLWNY